MKRKGIWNHYERAFEKLLVEKQLLYIAVDETKRPRYNNRKIKNFDFIVSSFSGKYLIDIKGKTFRYGNRNPRFENWVREADVSGLTEWSRHFIGFTPLLVFSYEITNPSDRAKFHDLYVSDGRTYGMVAVDLGSYYANAKPRSKGWGAINVPSKDFDRVAKPISEFIPEIHKSW